MSRAITPPPSHQPTAGFAATMNKGFRITFDNGWGVSVQWGIFNYCEHYHSGYRYGSEQQQEIWASHDAELAIIKPDGGFDGDVTGRCTPEEVAAIIAEVATRRGNP